MSDINTWSQVSKVRLLSFKAKTKGLTKYLMAKLIWNNDGLKERMIDWRKEAGLIHFELDEKWTIPCNYWGSEIMKFFGLLGIYRTGSWI